MTTEQPKSPPPPQPQQPPQDQPFAAGTMAAPAGYPHSHFNGGTYPPPAPPGAQFMYPYPPGMLYAYPPTMQGPPIQLSTSPAPIPSLKPKRKQVKMACTNCATACKRCDESRPCERCVKYGMSNSCVDGQRKERKKGVKRGPYKRKNKNETEAGGSPTYTEWQNAGTVPPATAAPAAPAMTPLPPFHAGAPEGFYPVYYPGFMPQQQQQDGHPPVDGAHPPQQMVPMFIPGFPPYHYPPPPGAVYAPAHMHPHLLQPPPPVPLASAAAPAANGHKKTDSAENTANGDQASVEPSNGKPSKKKGKGSSGSTSSTATTAVDDVEKDIVSNGKASSPSSAVGDDEDEEDEEM